LLLAFDGGHDMQTTNRWWVIVVAGALFASALSMDAAVLAQDDAQPTVDIHEVVGASRHYEAPRPPVERPVDVASFAPLVGLALGLVASAWVGHDMHTHHVRGPWMVITLLIWVVGLPLYLVRRRALIDAAAKEWEFLQS
jgi:hypothetical protein